MGKQHMLYAAARIFCIQISFTFSYSNKARNANGYHELYTKAPAFLAILFALMSAFSTKTFLLFVVSFSLRNF